MSNEKEFAIWYIDPEIYKIKQYENSTLALIDYASNNFIYASQVSYMPRLQSVGFVADIKHLKDPDFEIALSCLEDHLQNSVFKFVPAQIVDMNGLMYNIYHAMYYGQNCTVHLNMFTAPTVYFNHLMILEETGQVYFPERLEAWKFADFARKKGYGALIKNVILEGSEVYLETEV